jgi:hypothetical protein
VLRDQTAHFYGKIHHGILILSKVLSPVGWLVSETKNFPEKLFFSKISSSFSVLLRQKQVVRNLAIAVYLLKLLPHFCAFLCLLWLMGFWDGV